MKTESEARQVLVDRAYSWLGAKQGDTKHKQIIDTYNAYKPLPRGYTVTYTDAWCATFVSTVGIQMGWSDIILPECSCNQMIALYKAQGKWKADRNYIPLPGDLLMYDVVKTGDGVIDHVGIVAKVSGSTLTVIEGNHSKSVKERTVKVGDKIIMGYCLPNYAKKVVATPQPKPEPINPPAKENCEKFLTHLYLATFERKPDKGGLEHWVGELTKGATATEVAQFFYFSPEMEARKLNDAGFVETLYAGLFDRKSDRGGRDYWCDRLGRGETRQNVFRGFAYSEEFEQVCKKYGIKRA